MSTRQLAARLSDDDLFEMVNLYPKNTGLPMVIWLGPRGRARHAARIKVQMDHRAKFDLDHLAVVSVEDEPQVKAGRLSAADLEAVRRYIALNRRAILAHWSGDIDGIDLLRALKRL